MYGTTYECDGRASALLGFTVYSYSYCIMEQATSFCSITKSFPTKHLKLLYNLRRALSVLIVSLQACYCKSYPMNNHLYSNHESFLIQKFSVYGSNPYIILLGDFLGEFLGIIWHYNRNERTMRIENQWVVTRNKSGSKYIASQLVNIYICDG